ncbi:hypothetical protein HY029_04470 [Candidatus Gottesmanbacteria bacterium]|nr:hypothetical protein [Candidatus Gottesmanbacteria bacterium]
MKKILFSVTILVLSFSAVSLMKPVSVAAAEGGPAGKFMLWATPGPKAGEVTLRWSDADSAEDYHLVYGTNSTNMQYGVLNIGRSHYYIVGKLNPGTKYYFALVPVVNNVALYTSEWVAAWPMSGQTAMVTQPRAAVGQPMVSQPTWTTPTTMTPVASGPAGKFMLRAASGPKMGQVTLSWGDADSADNYHVIYGTDPNNMKYGALNIGTSHLYTIGKLNPGTKYYFALVPVMNNMALYTSEWVSAWAMGGQMVTTAPVTAMVPSNPSMTMQPAAPAMSMQPVGATNGPVGKLWLWAKSGPYTGEVTLHWRHVDDANNYHLVYGTSPGNYQYGALNIGWVNWYTVKALVPGVRYYFALVPVKNDVALYTSPEVMAWSYVPVQVVQTTKEAVMIPHPTQMPSATSGDYPNTPSASGQ